MNRVEYVVVDRRRTYFEVANKYEYRPERGWIWAQRVCLAVLKMIGAHAQDVEVAIEKHVLDADSFMERLFKQQSALMTDFMMMPELLLIGSADYAELMGDLEIQSMINFNVKYKIGYRGSVEVCGLRVVVVPWMKGMIVMPKDVI
jgi:hypothetical protein